MQRAQNNRAAALAEPSPALEPSPTAHAHAAAVSAMTRSTVAFLTIGSFSRANQAVLEILRKGFPEYEVEVIDVARLVRRDPIALVAGVLAVVRHYGPRILLQKGARWRAFFGTPWAFRAIGRKLHRRLGSTASVFTIQTQSLFDGSQPGVPHFVYTDHTARMNRHYPGGQDRIEAQISEDWLSLEADVYRNATRVLTQTERAASSVVEDYGVARRRVVCVHAGSHVRVRSTDTERPYAAKRILYVGTSWERKGGPELLEAFAQVAKRHPDAELVLVGPAPALTLPNVRAVGVIPPDALGRLLEDASVFCVPTRREPLGFVFIEAADHRLPIVATRVGSLPELVIHGESGLLVDVGDISGLADALCELLDDPERCRAFGERGRAHLADTWTWENVERQLVPELRAALAE